MQNLQALSAAMAASFGANDELLSAFQAEFTFLYSESAGDPEFAGMSKYFLIDYSEPLLNRIGLDSVTHATATKRITDMTAKLKKAIKASAKT